MKITEMERLKSGVADFAGLAIDTCGIRYAFFADRDGSVAVFRQNGRGYTQIEPNTPEALTVVVREAMATRGAA